MDLVRLIKSAKRGRRSSKLDLSHKSNSWKLFIDYSQTTCWAPISLDTENAFANIEIKRRLANSGQVFLHRTWRELEVLTRKLFSNYLNCQRDFYSIHLRLLPFWSSALSLWRFSSDISNMYRSVRGRWQVYFHIRIWSPFLSLQRSWRSFTNWGMHWPVVGSAAIVLRLACCWLHFSRLFTVTYQTHGPSRKSGNAFLLHLRAST